MTVRADFAAPSGSVARAAALARALGGEAHGSSATVPGPGHSPRDRSLSVRFDETAPDRFVVHSFASDDPIVCRDHVRDALGLPGFRSSRPVSERPKPAEVHLGVSDRERAAAAIWRQSVKITGTLSEAYLRARAIELDLGEFRDLRFHLALRFDDGTAAAMVALMRDIRTNEPCGVHRTFLDRSGRKLDRRMLGRAKGACVKLSDDSSVSHGLGVGEGIETSLSILQAGFAPVWACLSAGGVRAFPVLPGVAALTVFADRDDAGETAAVACCRRWREAGREPLAIAPPKGDWNDSHGVSS